MANGPFPVILATHGGSFKMGDKQDEQLTPMLKGLKRGYTVVSMNYGLSGEALDPDQINDCKPAVRWIRAGKTFEAGENMDKVFVFLDQFLED